MKQFKVKYFEDVVTRKVYNVLVNAKSFVKDGNMIIFYDNFGNNIAAFSNIISVKEMEKETVEG